MHRPTRTDAWSSLADAWLHLSGRIILAVINSCTSMNPWLAGIIFLVIVMQHNEDRMVERYLIILLSVFCLACIGTAVYNLVRVTQKTHFVREVTKYAVTLDSLVQQCWFIWAVLFLCILWKTPGSSSPY